MMTFHWIKKTISRVLNLMKKTEKGLLSKTDTTRRLQFVRVTEKFDVVTRAAIRQPLFMPVDRGD
jgi:hypothetical protein